MARAQRSVRWIGAAALLAGTAWVLYALANRILEEDSGTATLPYVLPLLAIGLVVLTLGLIGLLVRNLVRLVVDRKRGILGSRLRTKLVFFLLGFTLFPALVMAYGSAAVIKATVEAIVRTPVEDITSYSREIVDDWNDFLREHCLAVSGKLAAGMASRPDRPLDENEMRSWLESESLAFVMVLDGGVEPRFVLDPDLEVSRDEVERIALHALDLARAVRNEGTAGSRLDLLDRGLLVHAASPVGEADGDDPTAVVSVGVLHPRDLTARMRVISAQADAFRQFRIERRELVNLFLMIIAIVFLVTLFVATWIGFYLSRRITEPIVEMAAAAGEISSGNLQVRVRSATGDEVGLLVESFNDMAAQLQESREVISRSTADLRASNRALDERRRYIETLVANLSTAVISLDRHGSVTTANPAVERILGVRLRVGDDIREAVARENLAPLAEHFAGELSSGKASVGSEIVLPRGKGRITVSVHVSALRGARGEHLGTLIMVEDLTEVVRAQRVAAWREVARRIAHEIKNPLTPIQLAAQRLRKRFESRSPDFPDVVRESTESIEREVAGLKNLVDEFSRFARMPELRPQRVEILSMLESVAGLYRGHAGIRIRVESEPGPGWVELDLDQMRRALINLVDNAIGAMEGDGDLTMSVRAREPDGALRIEVADTGPGIPAEDREKLFEPYFSTKPGGTGLGLAIVHRVVTEHHGTIRVEDNAPRGARFILDIPVRITPEPDSE